MRKPKNLLEKGHAAEVEAPVTGHQRETGVGTAIITETGKGIEIGEHHVRRVRVGRETTAETGTEIEIGGEDRY